VKQVGLMGYDNGQDGATYIPVERAIPGVLGRDCNCSSKRSSYIPARYSLWSFYFALLASSDIASNLSVGCERSWFV
jgi:hypothetical protein